MISTARANKTPAILKINEIMEVMNETINPIKNKTNKMPITPKINISTAASQYRKIKIQSKEVNH